MKKIVGILAAAATLTASVFAADVSAGTRIKGNLFTYDGATEKISLFDEVNDSNRYDNPNFVFSISDDKAGATIKITSDGATKTAELKEQTIWFKPADELKITLGNFDVALNKEKIDWTESITYLGGNGYLVSVNLEGFGIDLGLAANGAGSFWLSKAKGSDADVKNFFVKAAHKTDFGTIGGFVTFNKTWGAGEYFNNFAYDMNTGVIKNLMFGAGYANTFSGVEMFVNVAGYMGKSFDWIRPEAYASGKVDAFGYSLFVAPTIFVSTPAKDAEIELIAKVTYALDGVTPYVYFKDVNLMNKKFVSTFKIGATGSVGLVGYDVCAQIDTTAAGKVNFAVPFTLSASF